MVLEARCLLASSTPGSPQRARNLPLVKLGGDASIRSLLKLFWPFAGISWEFLGLCGFESCYREALHRRCDTFGSFPPSSFCHVNVNMNHQDRSNSIRMAGFPAPAVTFRALFKAAILIAGTHGSLSEGPSLLSTASSEDLR